MPEHLGLGQPQHREQQQQRRHPGAFAYNDVII